MDLNLNDNSKNQKFSSKPIYQVTSAVAGYNRLVASKQDDLIEILREINVDQKKQTAELLRSVTPFSLIRRGWSGSSGNDARSNEGISGHFNFTYFQVGSFESADKLLAVTSHLRKQKGIWEEFFQFLDTQVGTEAVTTAVNWLRMNVLNSSTDVAPEFLYHHLLQLFVRTPIDGSIASSLYDFHSKIYGRHQAGLPCAYLIETVKPSLPALPLPDLLIWPVPLNDWLNDPKRIHQRALWSTESSRFKYLTPKRAQDTLKKLGDLFSNYLARLFGEEEFSGADSQPNRNTDRDLLGLKMLWIPLYDEWVEGRFQGCFQGWLFQTLNVIPAALRLKKVISSIDPKHKDRLNACLNEYIRHCLTVTNALSRDIYLAGIRELLSQQVKPNEKCDEFLSRNLHLVENWVPTKQDEPDGCGLAMLAKDDQIYWVEPERSKIYLDLRSLQVDGESEEFVKLEAGAKLTLKFGDDFILPRDPTDPYYIKQVNRLRALYARVKHNKLDRKYLRDAEWLIIFNQLRHNVNAFFIRLYELEGIRPEDIEPLSTDEPRQYYIKEIKSLIDFSKHMQDPNEYLKDKEKRTIDLWGEMLKPVLDLMGTYIEHGQVDLRWNAHVRHAVQGAYASKSLFRLDLPKRKLTLETYPVAARLMIKDVLTNALRNASDNEPIIGISVRIVDEGIELAVTNNRGIEQPAWTLWMAGRDDDGIYQESLGIKIMRAFMPALGWKWSIPRSCINGSKTTLIVTMPRSVPKEVQV